MSHEINLAELSKKTGKSEVEIAKSICVLLALKAEVYDIPQKVIFGSRQVSGKGVGE